MLCGCCRCCCFFVFISHNAARTICISVADEQTYAIHVYADALGDQHATVRAYGGIVVNFITSNEHYLRGLVRALAQFLPQDIVRFMPLLFFYLLWKLFFHLST